MSRFLHCAEAIVEALPNHSMITMDHPMCQLRLRERSGEAKKRVSFNCSAHAKSHFSSFGQQLHFAFVTETLLRKVSRKILFQRV